MINQLNGAMSNPLFGVGVAEKVKSFIPTDAGLDIGLQDDQDFDQLYAGLKKSWEANPNLTSMNIIEQLRKFINKNGEQPYKAISTQTSVIARVLERAKAEIGVEPPLYAALNESLCFAVVSNGMLNSFMAKMREIPKDPEPW